MRAAVIGIGAVGGWLLGRLTEGGADVIGVARGETLDVLGTGSPLTVEGPDGSWTGRVQVADQIHHPVDITIVAVKSTSTASLALPRSALVVSAQNGLGNVEAIRAMVTAPVTAAAVYTACHRTSATHIRVTSGGHVVVGDDSLASYLRSNGVPTQVVDDVEEALWRKVVVNVALNPLTALLDHTLGELRQSTACREIVQAAAGEAAAVASAEGFDVRSTADTILDLLDGLPSRNVTSMLQDRRLRRPMEIDALTGAVATRGATRGVPTPVVDVLHAGLCALASDPERHRASPSLAAITGAMAAAVAESHSSPRTYNG